MPQDNTFKCIAIIPARGGSKGIPQKNLQLVGGLPLVGRSIQAASGARLVGAVYVSTDDEEIAIVAANFGAQVIMRPVEISGDTASSESALVHALHTLKASDIHPEIIVFLQCTSPLTTPEAIDTVVRALQENPACSTAFSAVEDHGFLWGLDENGLGYGVNHDHTQPRKRRQDLPPRFRETGAIYAFRAQDFLRCQNRFCGATKPVLLDLPALEIDTFQDLHLISALLEARGYNRECRTVVPEDIAALITDFDGVHTDDRVVVDQHGTESVVCSRSDGMGIEMLKRAGIEVLILSKETNPVVAARAKKLGLPVIQQCDNKLETLEKWLKQRGLRSSQIAYMGNDVNDLECMRLAGWSCCPADAHPSVKTRAKYIAQRNGGQGAVREIAEFLLQR